MEKIWLKSYEAGVNAEIDPTHYTSMIDVVQQSVAKFGKQTAFYSMGKELSYQQIGELSDQFASYLQNVLKLPRGERVVVMMPNLLQYPIAVFGILKAGMVVVNTNPLYTPRELEHQLNDSGATHHHRAGKLCQHAGTGAAAHANQKHHHRQRGRNVWHV